MVINQLLFLKLLTWNILTNWTTRMNFTDKSGWFSSLLFNCNGSIQSSYGCWALGALAGHRFLVACDPLDWIMWCYLSHWPEQIQQKTWVSRGGVRKWQWGSRLEGHLRPFRDSASSGHLNKASMKSLWINWCIHVVDQEIICVHTFVLTNKVTICDNMFSHSMRLLSHPHPSLLVWLVGLKKQGWVVLLHNPKKNDSLMI